MLTSYHRDRRTNLAFGWGQEQDALAFLLLAVVSRIPIERHSYQRPTDRRHRLLESERAVVGE